MVARTRAGVLPAVAPWAKAVEGRAAQSAIASASFLQGPVVQPDARANLPNAITLCSLVLGVWWAFGGPWWAALGSVVLDEVDGRVARMTKQTSHFGSQFDWGTDLALTALSLGRLGVPWAIPLVTTGQVILRNHGYRPNVGSARAFLMVGGAIL